MPQFNFLGALLGLLRAVMGEEAAPRNAAVGARRRWVGYFLYLLTDFQQVRGHVSLSGTEG